MRCETLACCLSCQHAQMCCCWAVRSCAPCKEVCTGSCTGSWQKTCSLYSHSRHKQGSRSRLGADFRVEGYMLFQ